MVGVVGVTGSRLCVVGGLVEFFFLCWCASWCLLDGFLRDEVGDRRLILMGACGGMDFM